MTDLTSVAIPQPKDWQALERHCRLLFECSFGDTAVQNNGRNGQPQRGVDIFGRRDGGKGHWVGIQCKGKDVDYGGEVTEAELRDEVHKSTGFVPSIEEFIVVTTAPNDQKIQRIARLLEGELRTKGRELVIQVWGWDRVQQEINRFSEAIREFHPDATPFTDQLLDTQEDLKRLVVESTEVSSNKIAGIAQQLAQVLDRLPPITADTSSRTDALDKELHDQIDGYRDLIRNDRPRTGLDLLFRLKDRLGANASQRVRYRLLSNIGAAYYNLGQYEEASTFLLEAAPLNPDDPGSLANKAAALLIKDRKAEARALVADAFVKYPDSHELALLRLQALGAGETVESVWQSFSEKAKGAAIVFVFRLGVMREVNDQRWHTLIDEGCQLYPDDIGLKIFRAEGVIDRLLRSDPGAVGFMSANTPNQGEIRASAEFLEKTWRDSKGRETPAKPVCGHNAALAWNILGETERAAAVLDDIMAAGSDGDDTKQLRIAIYRRQGNNAGAIRLADQLNDTPLNRVMRADLRIGTAPAEAREILYDRFGFTNASEVIASALAVVESYVKEENFEAAIEEADRLQSVIPSHPQGALTHFRIKNARGDENTDGDLDRAIALVTNTTDFATLFIVAEAAISVKRYDDTVDLLFDHAARRFDSVALRALVAAAVAADRRVALRKILNDLPEELAHDLYYAKAKVAHSIHVGNITEAEIEIRAFLQREPNNLEMHIQLLHALFRQNKLDELKAAVSAPSEKFKGRPFDLIKLAHFMDEFGDWREAHALAYETLLANPSSQTVSMGYIGVFLRPGHSQNLSLNTPIVQAETAVCLRNEDGVATIFVIEPSAALRPSAQYLAPDHLVAKRLAGKTIGEAVEMPDKSTGIILWIKPKALYALHDVMENFSNRFPEAEGFERIRVDTQREGGFEPVLEKLRDRHDAIEQVAKLYGSGAMTLSLVGLSLGCDAVEAMVGLASTGHVIRVCEGSHVERERAFVAIDENKLKGCVVDEVTLHIIRRLKIEAAIAAICGPIHIVDETALRLQRKIHELRQRIDESDLSMGYRDNQYYRMEVMPEQKAAILKSLEADQVWLAKNTIIIPAEGSRDPSPQWRPLIERFGSGFIDEIRAAEGANLMLLSEDQARRGLSVADYVVPSTWLQPVLMQALERRVLSDDEYRDAMVTMVESEFQFISISAQLLLSAVVGTKGHVLPAAFDKLTMKIGGKLADLRSHASVAYQTAVTAWEDQGLTPTLKQAVVGRLLERLIDERSLPEVRDIFYGWEQLERRRRMRGDSMVSYLVGWLRGHFINLD